MRSLQIIKELSILVVATRPWNKKKFASKPNAILVRKTFERLGSVFIKLGQMLALRPDFVSQVFCDEFYNLLDNVPPFAPDEAAAILKSELGAGFRKLRNFDPIPVASASFSQVHKASLKNGDSVAVKIQRPEARGLVEGDIKIMKSLARLADVILRSPNSLLEIVNDFEAWTHDELDYSVEADNIEKFNQIALSARDGIRGPKVYRWLSTEKVLTMEYIEGLSLARLIGLVKSGQIKKLKKLGFDGREQVNKLIRNVLKTAHVYGFFHADPHPANIIFTPEGNLVYIDFGIVGSLSKRDRTLILRYFRELLIGKADESLDTLIRLSGGKVPDNIDELRTKYRALISDFMTTVNSKTYLEQQIKSRPILAGSLNLLQSNGIRMPVSLVRYFKAFETVEGLIFALYPNLQIKDMAREFRKVSILNIVDSLPTAIDGQGFSNLVFKLIDSLETSLLLSESIS